MTTAICKTCKMELPMEDFYPVTSEKLYRRKECKKCNNANQRKRYKPELRKNQHLKTLYGITLDEYNSILESQDKKCSICNTSTPNGKNNSFHLDHDHATNKIRGILCHSCNLMIGQAKDDVTILKSAIDYLNHWNAK